MFEFMPQTKNRIISSYARKDREAVMEQAILSVSNDFHQFIVNSEDPWVIYDLNNVFVCDNVIHRQMVGLLSNYDVSGRHVSEPPVPVYEVCSGDLIEQNEKIREGSDPKIKTLNIHPVGNNDNWFTEVCERWVFKNAAGQEAGIIVHGKLLLKDWQENARSILSMQNFFTGENQASIQVDIPKDLTDTQAEILFFLICRKEPKRIARYLNCSVNTVHSCIDRMRFKLDVITTQQLIDKAIFMDWHKLIPGRLVKGKHLSMILD